ncbi:TPA: F-box protein [Legionella pneumophila]
MQSKFEKFNELPAELKIETAQNLSNRDLVNLAQTSKYHLALFQPLLDVRKLLHYVARGDHNAVEAMLKKDMSLIFKRGVVTDCSGREFENISAFEYALWALDKHMWAAMIACIPQNEEGRKVFAQLIAQYNKVNTDGVTYKLNGKTITEQHFDFNNTIIKELQTQVDSLNAPGVKHWDAIDKQWREGVGSAQNLFPMHVVYEYCSDEPFYPVPKFTSQPKSSKQFFNWTTDKDENWFSVASKLSVDFAIYKGGRLRPGSGARCVRVVRGSRVCAARGFGCHDGIM